MSEQSSDGPQKFATNIIWVAISQVVFFSVGLVTLPALTKSFSPATYGAWVQILVTMQLIGPILTLQLGSALVRFLAAEEDATKRRHTFSAALWPVIIFACLLLIISWLMREGLSSFLFASPLYVDLIPLTFLWISVDALFSLCLSYLLARDKIKMLSIFYACLSIVKMSLILLLSMAGCSLAWIIADLIAAQTIIGAVIFGVIVKEIGWPVANLDGLKGYLAFSVPQIPSGFLLGILDASGKFFITHYLNLSQTGIYAASYAIGTLIVLFYRPIDAVIFPTVSRLWEQGEISRVRSYFEYSTKLFLALAIPGAGGIYLLSQPLLLLVTTSDYTVGGVLVLLVALGTVLLGIYQINVYIILLVKQTRWLPLMMAMAAVINVGINLALIPNVGIMGAAISTAVSYFILAAIVIVWARSVISYNLDIIFLIKVVAGTLMMVLCLSFITISGIVEIIITAASGAGIFALWMWLFRAFRAEDWAIIQAVLIRHD